MRQTLQSSRRLCSPCWRPWQRLAGRGPPPGTRATLAGKAARADASFKPPTPCELPTTPHANLMQGISTLKPFNIHTCAHRLAGAGELPRRNPPTHPKPNHDIAPFGACTTTNYASKLAWAFRQKTHAALRQSTSNKYPIRRHACPFAPTTHAQTNKGGLRPQMHHGP